MEAEIRPAQPQDLGHLSQIEEAADSLFAQFPGLLPEPQTLPFEALKRAAEQGLLSVAVVGQKIAGFIMVELVEAEPHIEGLAVHPDFQRQGIGTLLVSAVVAWSIQEGFDHITLSTFSTETGVEWNQPFYQKFGFRVLDDDQLSPGLLQIRALEAKEGKDLSKRVIMGRPAFR